MYLPSPFVRIAVPLVLIAVSVFGAGWKWDIGIPH
jgi:hypothetical protein